MLIDRIRQRTAAHCVMVNRSEVVQAGPIALVSIGMRLWPVWMGWAGAKDEDRVASELHLNPFNRGLTA